MQGYRYIVKTSDSLSSIAKSHLGSARRWPRIVAYNNRRDIVAYTKQPLKHPDKLLAGQVLMIPPPEQVHGRPNHAADHRHPMQRTTPSVAPQTEPAQGPPQAHAALPAPHGGSRGTTVNSFPFKYKLDLIPKQTVEGPNYIATIKFDGTVVIWLDRQIPVLTITNKGAEATAKHETDGVFGKLVQSEKVSWEPGSNKATFEDMLTANAHGMPPSLTSVGFAVDSDNPVPAMRFKFTAPTLKGKLGEHLYVAEGFTVTLDLRPKPNDPDITRRPDPVRVPVPHVVPAPDPVPWYAKAGHWAWDHRVEIGVGVVVVAVVASNFLTAGADTEADPAVATWAAREVAEQAAKRAAVRGFGSLAPAFAH